MTEAARSAPLSAPVATLTLNPAIDVTIGLDRLETGEVNRAKTYRAEPGGKGVNVAATLAAGGVSAAATGILGRDNADIFSRFFAERKIENGFLLTEGATRSNIKLVSAAETTDVNLPGLPATAELLNELRQMLAAAQSRLLILSGSVPPHCPDNFYADFLAFYAEKAAHMAKPAKCIVDCSGAPLKALLAGRIRPFAIKPNNDELAEWAGKPLNSREDILREARALHKTGIALVVISMGAEGALFVAGPHAYHAGIKLAKVESTVGAGDAMVAGIASALLKIDESGKLDAIDAAALEHIAKTATLWASGKLLCHGPALPPAAQMQALAAQMRCEKLS